MRFQNAQQILRALRLALLENQPDFNFVKSCYKQFDSTTFLSGKAQTATEMEVFKLLNRHHIKLNKSDRTMLRNYLVKQKIQTRGNDIKYVDFYNAIMGMKVMNINTSLEMGVGGSTSEL